MIAGNQDQLNAGISDLLKIRQKFGYFPVSAVVGIVSGHNENIRMCGSHLTA